MSSAARDFAAIALLGYQSAYFGSMIRQINELLLGNSRFGIGEVGIGVAKTANDDLQGAAWTLLFVGSVNCILKMSVLSNQLVVSESQARVRAPATKTLTISFLD
jgi:hypothetical protein